MPKRAFLGQFEEVTLRAVQYLREEAYGAAIWEALESAGRGASIGSLYVTLDRLEKKGLVTSEWGEPTPERGGRRKRFYTITGDGVKALHETEQARQRVSVGWGLDRAGGAA